MLRDIQALTKETVVYGLSTVAARLLNLLLLPFYTHYLGRGDYGVVATLYSYIAFLNVIYHFGLDQAYLRFAAGKGEDETAEVFASAFWPMAAASLALSALIHLNAEPLARLADLPGQEGLIRLSGWIVALDAIAAVPFAELRLRHRAWTFAGLKTANIVLNVALNLGLLAAGLGGRAVFLASLGASAATLILLFPILRERLRPIFEGRPIAELLRFGLPLVPAGLAAMAVQVVDRPILQRLTDEATVGLYQANYRLGIFMMMVVTMFDQAWRPFFLERAEKPGGRELMARVLTYFLAGGCWLVLGLSLFIADLVRVQVFGRPIIHADYWAGLGIVPVVLTAYLFHGCYVNFNASITLSKRTEFASLATLLGAAVNIAANLLLVPYWGIHGAAWAALLAYASMAAALYGIGRSLYPIPYEYGRLGHLAGAAVAVGALAVCGDAYLQGGAWLLARLGILLLFPALLAATGFFTEEERAYLGLSKA